MPTELLEAAELDGAGPARRFWHVSWPLLVPVLIFFLALQKQFVKGLTGGATKG